MKKVVITIYGVSFADLADACEHARDMLRIGTPSERVTWENRTHVNFDVEKSSDAEFCEQTGEEPLK